RPGGGGQRGSRRGLLRGPSRAQTGRRAESRGRGGACDRELDHGGIERAGRDRAPSAGGAGAVFPSRRPKQRRRAGRTYGSLAAGRVSTGVGGVWRVIRVGVIRFG